MFTLYITFLYIVDHFGNVRYFSHGGYFQCLYDCSDFDSWISFSEIAILVYNDGKRH